MSNETATAEKKPEFVAFPPSDAMPVRYAVTERSVIVAGRHYKILYTKLDKDETAGDQALKVERMVIKGGGLQVWTYPATPPKMKMVRIGVPLPAVNYWMPEDA